MKFFRKWKSLQSRSYWKKTRPEPQKIDSSSKNEVFENISSHCDCFCCMVDTILHNDDHIHFSRAWLLCNIIIIHSDMFHNFHYILILSHNLLSLTNHFIIHPIISYTNSKYIIYNHSNIIFEQVSRFNLYCLLIFSWSRNSGLEYSSLECQIV